MDIVDFTVKSVTPLLQNNPASMLTPKTATAKAKSIPTPAEEAESGVYRAEDGTIYHPAAAFRRALISAATNRKIGKTAATSIVKGSVFQLTERCPLVDPDSGKSIESYSIDVRRCVLGGKTAVVRARPRIERWMTTIEFEYDPDFISADALRELLVTAGQRVGIGNYRPEKAGIFGRFQVA